MTSGEDVGQHGDLIADGQTLVLQAEAVGDGEGDIDLVDAGSERAVIALAVEDEADAAAARVGGKGGHHVFGAGHLGHEFRMDEADRLDAAGAGGLKAQNELGAGRRVEDGLLVLQAVAGADLDDLDRAAQRRVSGASGP